jgi:hypothetical protein
MARGNRQGNGESAMTDSSEKQQVSSNVPSVAVGDTFKLPDGIWTVLYLKPGGVACLHCNELHMQIQYPVREVKTWERSA